MKSPAYWLRLFLFTMVQDLDHFLDHVHLLPQGSALLARIVGDAFNEMLEARLESDD